MTASSADASSADASSADASSADAFSADAFSADASSADASPPVREAYLGLGSNRGVRLFHLQAAVDGLAADAAVGVTGVSPVYASEAHTLAPEDTQPAFLNAVVAVQTTRSPEGLLALAQRLERAAGRADASDRPRWAPRTLDVDLLVVGAATRDDARLTLPHPRLGERRFVLRPWADLAPNLRVPPPFDATVGALLDRCDDPGAIVRTAYPLVLG